MNYNLVAYAQDFASFFLQQLKQPEKIQSIILFGSAVRGEAKKTSDIDIFIETSSDIEKELMRIKEKFSNSIKVKKYWTLLGIQNEFHCEIGLLDEWKDLEKSLHAQGVVLFGKYSSRREGQPHYLFSITQMDERRKSIALWRKLYGYTQKVGNKEYVKKGMLKELGGEKIARGVFIVPSQDAQMMQHFLKNSKVKYTLMLFWK